MSDDFDLKDLFAGMKEESRAKKSYNRFSSEEILIQKKIPYKIFTADHFRVGDFDFWPATGLFIHVKTKKRGRGVFKLIKNLEKK
jgi:hypothetical protein